MKSRLVLGMAAALLASGCNMADDWGDEETASRDRLERKERERDARSRNAIKERPKLEQAKLEPQIQPASSAAPSLNQVGRSWFAGSWTDTGDCADAARFNPDGTFVLADGARGMWNVREGKLVIQGAGGRSELPLQRIAPDTVEVKSPDGSVGRSTRC